MAIIDVISYNGEADLLEMRLTMLDPYVDQFIICEAKTTFSGREKPLYFDQQGDRFDKWQHKIKYYICSEQDDRLWDMAWKSTNTQGASHWKREFVQKEEIKKALTHLQDSDIVFVGDCDEIWSPEVIFNEISEPTKLRLRVYTYYLNNRSSEEFCGTLHARYKDIKSACLNHLRTYAKRGDVFHGWHFTSMAAGLKQKLLDSYTEESYANETVMRNLEENINSIKDFLGRPFTYWKDETEWPQYLKDNKDKYLHLCLK